VIGSEISLGSPVCESISSRHGASNYRVPGPHTEVLSFVCVAAGLDIRPGPAEPTVPPELPESPVTIGRSLLDFENERRVVGSVLDREIA
jgi:hypothetical protein